MIQIQVTGVKRTSTAIRRAGKKIHKAAIYGTRNWMKGTMNFSRKLAPEDTGATKASVFAYLSKDGRGKMGFATWYAPIIHFTGRHGGQPNFLSEPVMNRSFDGSLGKEVKTQLHQKRVSTRRYSVNDEVDVTTALSLRPGSIRA